ncbi:MULTISPECIES: hypothetical protein [Brevibacillus]|jgi:energy-coupling factor transporter transmembrane protein EcfT|uniref:Uncharacterized protein n=1 Tax=Brevibacillus borstelensis AK1 TaxID=1300222 RepID=M8E875_9BACL|nr:hypothetical protein [Brevibacillus borstelensis]EMT51655.1 hypothetical protein I532_17063 [Brevibacillus borstelensis AK1]KKX56632.1 membrane protein [Brevibacillus borstelensis cifa_chp40]MBE5397435.1 hypothetical protein [Brevibacillus borstelensis]MCC0562909.1 hypothetical protein [Brevibacillus borstelensis]MCM3470359.1 hypothetical protein [Brevibacillus borstelensis]
MSMVTLPAWFWAIYYLFLFATLALGLWSLARKKMKSASIVAIIFAITVPLVSLVNSIGRAEGTHELNHLISQLQEGAVWSVYVSAGYLYLLVWWMLFFSKGKDKPNKYAAK